MDELVMRLLRYDAPCGVLWLGAVNGRLCMCRWESGKGIGRYVAGGNDVIEVCSRDIEIFRMAADWLDCYFSGDIPAGEPPMEPVGTEFQHRVWEQLAKIPYGTTVSYTAIARCLGSPRSVRAVARAIGANPLAIFIPCHRVIGENGALTGYAGGIEVKRYLLDMEGGHSSISSKKVDCAAIS